MLPPCMWCNFKVDYDVTMVTDMGGPANISPPTLKQLRADKLDTLHHLSEREREMDQSSEDLLYFPIFPSLSLSLLLPFALTQGLWRTVCCFFIPVYIQMTKTWPIHIKNISQVPPKAKETKCISWWCMLSFIRQWELENHPIAIFALATRNLRTKSYDQPY